MYILNNFIYFYIKKIKFFIINVKKINIMKVFKSIILLDEDIFQIFEKNAGSSIYSFITLSIL